MKIEIYLKNSSKIFQRITLFICPKTRSNYTYFTQTKKADTNCISSTPFNFS
nr:MAG TPA: hypothetical protein [Caudoviricetes sp.]